MSELNLQKKICKQLRKEIKKYYKKLNEKYNMYEQNPHLSGSTDLVITHENASYCIEIKLKPNSQLFFQLNKQRLSHNYLIALSFKPSREITIRKWKENASKKNINLFFVDKKGKTVEKILEKSNLVKNDFYNPDFVKGVNNVKN